MSRLESQRLHFGSAFILSRIADKEKIFATEDEVSSHVQMLAMYYGMPPARLLVNDYEQFLR